MTTVPRVLTPRVPALATATSNPATTSSSGNTATSSTSSPASTGGLSETDFFKIMSAELANQDPTSPTNSTQFITQMAQFSELSVLTSMQTDLQNLVQADQAQAAPILNGAALLGKTVTTSHGSGVVQGATVQNGTTYLTVAGQSTAIPLSAITSITES